MCILYMFISDITLHMPNENNLLAVDGILSPDEGEAKMFIPKQVIEDELTKGQYHYDSTQNVPKEV